MMKSNKLIGKQFSKFQTSYLIETERKVVNQREVFLITLK